MEINLVYSGVLFASNAISLPAALYAWRMRHRSWGGWLAALLLCIALYSTGYAFELLSSTLETMRFFLAIEYMGLSLMPTVIIMITLAFADKSHYINKKTVIPLFTISAVTFLIHITSGIHNLYYIDPAVDYSAPFPLFSFKPGIWYHFQTVYTQLSLLFLIFHLITRYRNNEGAFRPQIIIMMAGSVLPWAGHIFYLSGFSPYGIDVNPLFLTATGLLFFLALFRFRLLNLLPVARERVIESLKDGIIIIDNHNRIVDLNRSASEIFKELSTALTGSDVESVFNKYPEIIKVAAPPDHQRTDLRIIENGINRIYEARSCPVEDRKGNKLAKAIIVSDITLKAHLLDRLKELASHDELTRASNRRHFLELCGNELLRAARYSRPLTLLYIDIDFFKKVNDNFGHAAGDAALVAVSDICRKSLRQTDIFGRYGGEEFAVLLPETGPDLGHDIAERLREKIASMQFYYEGIKIDLSASIGVTGLNRVLDENIESLLKKADTALYQAKASGRNKVMMHS